MISCESLLLTPGERLRPGSIAAIGQLFFLCADFIQAVVERANKFGLHLDRSVPIEERGDIVVIGGQAHPEKVRRQRRALEERIKRSSFDLVMEEIAYTWFNRFAALRYMEIHGYHDHGYRVLSHPNGGGRPEILDHAEDVDLTGLNRDRVIDLKLDGSKDEKLYRMLLVAQCNELSKSMEFLFERIDDETELLLPDNLLYSDSLIRKMVEGIDEEDWQEIEIIGWIYQFYISEKKDQVIGKVVKSEDIPAATQLFTPNWIVKYMVENTLGRKWLATYPDSPLRERMEFYIESAEQTPEAQEQLNAITPESLNPEEITFLDPACGSGHILVEAYDLFKAIYEERGYPAKDIPRLILEKNLFGLEIDDRAAQLAGFALLMKSCADDRHIFVQGIQPHVLSIQESKGLDAREITEALNAPLGGNGAKGATSQADVAHLIDLFEPGKTFGSLIRVPEKLAEKLPTIAQRVEDVIGHSGMFEQSAVRGIRPLLVQAHVLSARFDAVVANPPYMTSDYMPQTLKKFIKRQFNVKRTDLYALFIQRSFTFGREHTVTSMISGDSWMFLPTYERLRHDILTDRTVVTMAHLGPHAFDTIGGHVVQSVMLAISHSYCRSFTPKFYRLVHGDHKEKRKSLLARHNSFQLQQEEFRHIPGSPFVYWASEAVRAAFSNNPAIGELVELREGIHTGKNDRFMRYCTKPLRGRGSQAPIGFDGS